MERQINEFNFTIGGQIDNIDVHSLTATLLNLNDILKEVNSELKTNHPIELTVKTYKPGSFDIYLQLISDGMAIGAAAGLFNAENLAKAKNVIETTVAILGLKKFLKGKPPKEIMKIEGDNFKLEDIKGNVFIIKELHLNIASTNTSIEESTEKVFNTLNNIPYVSGLSIKDHENKIQFEADKTQDFGTMLKPNPLFKINEDNTRDETVENAILSVYSIIFDDSRQWEFFYEGNKVSAKLKDENFLQQLLKRQITLLNGDRLKCRLIKHQVFNIAAQVYQNKKYTIEEVYEIIPPEPIQEKIQF